MIRELKEAYEPLSSFASLGMEGRELFPQRAGGAGDHNHGRHCEGSWGWVLGVARGKLVWGWRPQ